MHKIVDMWRNFQDRIQDYRYYVENSLNTMFFILAPVLTLTILMELLTNQYYLINKPKVWIFMAVMAFLKIMIFEPVLVVESEEEPEDDDGEKESLPEETAQVDDLRGKVVSLSDYKRQHRKAA